MQICTNPTERHRAVNYVELAQLIVFGWFVLLFLVGCESCNRSVPLGRLIEKSGSVERDFEKAEGNWLSAAAGAEFEVNDAVRTLRGGSAQLALDDGSILVMDEETLIRFLERKPGSTVHSIDLKMGAAMVEAPSEPTTIVTAFGRARILAGAKVRLERHDDALQLKVIVGKAELEAEGGAQVVVEAGQSVVARLGSAVIEPTQDETRQGEPQDEATVRSAGGPIVAEVLGGRVLMRGPAEKELSKLAAGSHTLSAGSLVEVGAGSSVSVSLGDAQAQLAAGGTFLVGQDGQLVQATRGSFTLRSTSTLRLAVPGGFIETQGGATQVSSLGAAGTEVRVESGQARLLGKTTESLGTGESGRIQSDGTVSVLGRGLDHSDLDISVGQSLVIHDPSPPTAIGFTFGERCVRGVIRLNSKSKSALPSGDFARGEKRVALLVGAGHVDYSLSCVADDGQVGAVNVRGTVTVLADAGSKPVPLKAPATTVEANGRAYTVLYQNQLPAVTIRWPGAPGDATTFKIKRTTSGQSRTYSSSSASYTFSPGALGEGSHQLFFEGGGRVSRLTTVNILFDNATPAASLQTPAGAGGPPGSELRLVGSALPGWVISVDGKASSPDAEGRFSVTTHMPPAGRPALLYLTHEKRGAHVYLRKAAGAP